MLGKCHYKLEEFELARVKFKMAARIDREDFKSTHIWDIFQWL
jgi:hypothetical protein